MDKNENPPKKVKKDTQMDYFKLIGGDRGNSIDALLVADDGTRFPCHSQVLFIHSPVLAGMEELQEERICDYKYSFPLECKADDVGLMLLEIYRAFQCAQIASSYSGYNAESVKGLVSIAHMLGMKRLLERAEGWLTYKSDVLKSSTRLTRLENGATVASKIISWMQFARHFQPNTFRGACESAIAGDLAFYARNVRAELEMLSPTVLINIAVKSEQLYNELDITMEELRDTKAY